MLRWLCAGILAVCGWKIHGDWPPLDRAVVVAAPHTSNWDAFYMLAAAAYFRITLRWMGKESLTRGPFGGLVRAMGCVPVDRSARNDLVRAMSDEFAARKRMLLAIPPEGTRSLTRGWKTGFYYIAFQARVPLILSVLDYGTKTIRIAGVFHPTGDYEADILAIGEYYRGATGKHEARFGAA
jgi:1-acyl-sn-glycerol-3-phosphate acyltransferase